MADEKPKELVASKVRALFALGMMLGGERMAIGMERIIDGKCPDCGDKGHGRCEKLRLPVQPENENEN